LKADGLTESGRPSRSDQTNQLLLEMRFALFSLIFDYNNQGATQRFDIEVLNLMVSFKAYVPDTRGDLLCRVLLDKALSLCGINSID
jgi:hypothetical protein